MLPADHHTRGILVGVYASTERIRVLQSISGMIVYPGIVPLRVVSCGIIRQQQI